ncbi:hypothetical protein CTI12_AA007300 [Artemisia annua]|uniref:Uncharacterized protein n=1 Tax=Artemisia annua TaxID=35608 RepID=A0A2U1QN78_ARTAN|nr:hypothetical protein CTI12_AA007300 [Artemisia annua]
MPSGAKKRKAAKKKQVHNPSSSSSASTNPIQGENDGGELNSPTSQDPSIEVEKVEHEKNSKDEGSKSKSSSSSSSDSSDDESRVVDKEVVVTESVPVVEPERLAPIVDEPVKEGKPLVEEVAHVTEEKKDLVVEDVVAPVVVEEETVGVSEIDSKEDCPTSSEVVEPVLKESEVEKLPLSDEKACVEKEDVASSTPAKDSISEVNGASGANETDTVEHSDRQAPVASTPLSVQKTTSWKSCCGLFDLFSGSER